MCLSVRDASADDLDALGALFFRSVREGAAPCYSEAERAAWAPEMPSGADWARRLEGLELLMAEQDDTPLGFMAVSPEGYLDMAFVTPEARAKGVSDAIYAVLECRARSKRLHELSTHASLMAKSFFERQGWNVGQAEDVARGAETLRRYRMTKAL
ncbi:GNAT family N-acetyltransferase [Rhodobacteraceae bacterium 63075]|nr:GNAT family N-acetyltransferase [Rhodobacteraceae bacterium 63075]